MTARPHVHRWLPRSIGLMVAFVALLAMIVPVSAEEATVKLSIKPVGEDNSSYFTITADPSETVQLAVELGNDGAVQMAATTFAADTFTMPNGGFGIQGVDAIQTATTLWITYPTETVELQPGETVTRTFPLTVPADTKPGDYLTSLVIQNANPIQGEGAVALNQIIRQAVAISIDVPGERAPALAISSVQHDASGANSVVTFDVVNTGNTHLKPVGEFALTDASGVEIDRRSVSMDRLYAGTQTTFAVAFDHLLASGEYFAELSLKDPDTGATAHFETSPVTVPVVDVPATLNTDGSVAEPAQSNAPVTVGSGSSRSLQIAIAVTCLVLGASLTIGVMRLRTSRAGNQTASTVQVVPLTAVTAPTPATRPGRVKPLIPRPDIDQERSQASVVKSSAVTDTQ